MRTAPLCHDKTAPDPFRAALAELVQIGLAVARMVGHAAEAESTSAKAASTAAVAADVSPLATSLAEAMEADRAAAAAAEARRAVITRTETVAAAFNQTARAIRRTILLAERLDRGWAHPIIACDHQATALRQIARAVTAAINCQTEGDRAERLIETLAERLDALDTLDDVTSRPVEDIIREFCRDLGLEVARRLPSAVHPAEPGPATGPPARAAPAWDGALFRTPMTRGPD